MEATTAVARQLETAARLCQWSKALGFRPPSARYVGLRKQAAGPAVRWTKSERARFAVNAASWKGQRRGDANRNATSNRRVLRYW